MNNEPVETREELGITEEALDKAFAEWLANELFDRTFGTDEEIEKGATTEELEAIAKTKAWGVEANKQMLRG